MLLRDRVLNNKMYTFNQMGSFGKCGMGNELVYNSGFSLVTYIAENYGESTLKDISNSFFIINKVELLGNINRSHASSNTPSPFSLYLQRYI